MDRFLVLRPKTPLVDEAAHLALERTSVFHLGNARARARPITPTYRSQASSSSSDTAAAPSLRAPKYSMPTKCAVRRRCNADKPSLGISKARTRSSSRSHVDSPG